MAKRMNNSVKYFAAAVLLLLSLNAHSKNIVINIDGTNNSPDDGHDEFDRENRLKDESISNVFKMHLFAGGTFPNRAIAANTDAEQISLYYIGVGNPDQYHPWQIFSRIGAKEEALFAIHDPQKIEAIVLGDLTKHYNENDILYIFGFSRGAAIARMLAQKLATIGIDKGANGFMIPKIRFLGVWDTVAAIGLPNDDDPTPEELGESGSVHSGIEEVLHLVSADETRKTFRPTLIRPRDKVTEIWFPGVHSDIGGGYNNDGLSDIALRFMIDKADDAELTIFTLAEAIDNLQPTGIEVERLKIEPDAHAMMHKPKNWKSEIIRKIRVLKNGSHSTIPRIHQTIIDRKKKGTVDNDGMAYDPPNLSAINCDGETNPSNTCKVIGEPSQ